MFDFLALSHFEEQPALTPVEVFFHALNEKVHLYEHHCLTTTNLYRTEYSDLRKKNQEKHAAIRNKRQEIFDEIMAETDDYALADHESRLDELEENFAEYQTNELFRFTEMADYFNKSSVVVFYSFLESELRNLCALLKSIFKKRIDLENLNNKNYLQAILSYLDLVIELPITKLQSYISRFQELQFLRNKIVHNGAEFSNDDDKQRLQALIVKSSGMLEIVEGINFGTKMLKIKSINYLLPYYIELKLFFYDLFCIIENKSNQAIISSKLKFLFSFISKNISVQVKDFKAIKGGTQIVCNIESTDPSTKMSIQCKTTLTSAKKNELEIIDQSNSGNEMLERLLNYMSANPSEITKKIFGFFELKSTANKIKMMFYPIEK